MRMVWIGSLFVIFASCISLVAAICDTVPANIKLGLFVNGDYESYRIRNSVQLALQAISSTRFGVSLGIDSITLSESNTFLDGCFRNTSSLDPQFPANNPSSIASALQTGFSTMITNGVHAVIGPSCDSAFVQAANLSNSYQIPLLGYQSMTGLVSSSLTYPYVLRLPLFDNNPGLQIFTILKSLKIPQYAIIYADDFYNNVTARGLYQLSVEAGFDVILNAALDSIDVLSASNNATIASIAEQLNYSPIGAYVILVSPLQADVIASAFNGLGLTGPAFVYTLGPTLDTPAILRNDYSYAVYGNGIVMRQQSYASVYANQVFRAQYSQAQFAIAGDSPGPFGQFAYDAVFAVANSIINMRAACVSGAQIANRTNMAPYLRNITFQGASGNIQWPQVPIVPVVVNGTTVNMPSPTIGATGNNRIFPQEFHVVNIQGLSFVDVGAVKCTTPAVITYTSGIVFPGGNSNPFSLYRLGILYTPPSGQSDPQFAELYRIPYMIVAATNQISNPLAFESQQFFGGRDVMLVLPSHVQTDDCGATNKHFASVRAMMSTPLPPIAIVGAMCSNVVRALYGPDPSNPTDPTFPLQIPILSYGAVDDDLSNSTKYPLFKRIVLSTATEIKALLTIIQSYGWRRISVVYSNDTLGNTLFSDVSYHAPSYSQRIDFSYALDLSIVNNLDSVSIIQNLVLTPMLDVTVNTKVLLILLSSSTYYVPFLKACYNQKFGVPLAGNEDATPVQFVGYHTMRDILDVGANPQVPDWVANMAQGAIYAYPNFDTSPSMTSYNRSASAWSLYMTNILTNYLNTSNTPIGAITRIGLTNPLTQAAQVPNLVSSPGKYGPLAWDAVITLGAAIQTLNLAAVAINNNRTALVATATNSINAQKAATAAASAACSASNCTTTATTTSTSVTISSSTGTVTLSAAALAALVASLVAPSINNGTELAKFISTIDTNFTATGRMNFLTATNDRPGFNKNFVVKFYQGRDSSIPALTDLVDTVGYMSIDYTSGAYSGQQYYVRQAIPSFWSCKSTQPVQSCAAGSIGSFVTSGSVKIGTECTPCEMNYYPNPGGNCTLCPVNTTFCVYGGAQPYPTNVYWKKASVQSLPPSSGPYATEADISSVTATFWIYMLTASFIIAGAAGTLLMFTGDLRRLMRRTIYYFDICFRQGQHYVPFGKPLIYKETAIGGFIGFSWAVLATFIFVFIIQLFLITQFVIVQTMNEGVSAMTSTPTPFTFNLSFVSVDSLSSCMRLCSDANMVMNSQANPLGSFACEVVNDGNICVTKFTMAPNQIYLSPTQNYSVQLNYVGTRTHGFYFNASGLSFSGSYIGFNKTLEAPSGTVFFGTQPSYLYIDVLPFQWNGNVGATRSPLVQSGYLTAYNSFVPGSYGGKSTWTASSSPSAGTIINVSWTVRNSVQVYNVQVADGFLTLISQIGGVLGSNLFRVCAATLVISELFWNRYLQAQLQRRAQIEEELTHLRQLRQKQHLRVANLLLNPADREISSEEQRRMDVALDAMEEKKIEEDVQKAKDGDKAAQKRVELARLDWMQKKQATRRRRNQELFQKIAQNSNPNRGSLLSEQLEPDMLIYEVQQRADKATVMKVTMQTIREDTESRQLLIRKLLGLLKRRCVLDTVNDSAVTFPYPWIEPAILDCDYQDESHLHRLQLAKAFAAEFVSQANDELKVFLSRRSNKRLGEKEYVLPEVMSTETVNIDMTERDENQY